jgi:hypothetical protein
VLPALARLSHAKPGTKTKEVKKKQFPAHNSPTSKVQYERLIEM